MKKGNEFVLMAILSIDSAGIMMSGSWKCGYSFTVQLKWTAAIEELKAALDQQGQRLILIEKTCSFYRVVKVYAISSELMAKTRIEITDGNYLFIGIRINLNFQRCRRSRSKLPRRMTATIVLAVCRHQDQIMITGIAMHVLFAGNQ